MPHKILDFISIAAFCCFLVTLTSSALCDYVSMFFSAWADAIDTFWASFHGKVKRERPAENS